MIDLAPSLSKIEIDLGDIAQGLPAIVKFCRFWVQRNDQAVQDVFKSTLEGWIIEERQATAQMARRLTARETEIRGLDAKLEALASDPCIQHVRKNYAYEACREALPKRRRMLAYASADLLALDLTVEQKARVERTLRILDPAEIELLEILHGMGDPAPPIVPEHMRGNADHEKHYREMHETQIAQAAESRYACWDSKQPSGHILLSAGCVYTAPFRQISWAGKPPVGLALTEVGEWVLQAMDLWLKKEKVDHD
ncbi:MAG TPA: hypothetical protein VGJ84_22845 [Polyangiaceae bacterium]